MKVNTRVNKVNIYDHVGFGFHIGGEDNGQDRSQAPPTPPSPGCHSVTLAGTIDLFEVSGCHKPVTRVSQGVTSWWLMAGELIVDGMPTKCRGGQHRDPFYP